MGRRARERAARARFSNTATRSSWPDRLQFRLAKGPVETPPRRVKKPCGAGSVSAVKASAILVGQLHAELIRAVCAVCASPVNQCYAHPGTKARPDSDSRSAGNSSIRGRRTAFSLGSLASTAAIGCGQNYPGRAI